MKQEREILLGKKKRRAARNETNTLPLQIASTSKPLVRKDLKSVVDLYDVYMGEYGKCHRYRLTLTIKPYCTNVLYNVCTEIVKKEGDDNCIPVSDNSSAGFLEMSDVYGKTNALYRNYMVSNTEYSSPDVGFDYLPGYDIFSNHTLRNLSFRPIIPYANDTQENRRIFNTLRDCMRSGDGKEIMFFPRFSEEDIENNTKIKMHVYEHSNLLSFIDGSSPEANLKVENGWYGFVNTSSLTDTSELKTPIVQSENHIFTHTINKLGNCEFVDMFPDRERYSFVPMYNRFKKRYEKNWDVFLTYPWKNFYEHNLVKNVRRFGNWDIPGSGDTVALAIMRVYRAKTSANRDTMLFRSYCRHNLSVNDKVAIFASYDGGENYQRLPREYTVDYLGDVEGKHSEYFFGISTKTLLNDLFKGHIDDVFYNTNTQGLQPVYSVSHEITEVPTVFNDNAIILYFYANDIQHEHYGENATFDEMPKTVNEQYPTSVNIRVWNREYVYMAWDENSNSYVNSNFNPQVEYGEWNTFTDVPDTHEKDYIRVKTYSYYYRDSKKYKMKDIVKDLNGFLNDEFFERNSYQFRFVKVVNGVDCDYYIRQFRKIPNLKFSEEPLPKFISENDSAFNSFISRNVVNKDGTMLTFDAETYKLAFAKTIYGDDVVQMTFLDDIDVTNLTDNLGRPVTEIYSTIVKRNKGYEVWYGNMGANFAKLGNTSDVEFSRCFGSVTTGFEYLDIDDVFDRKASTRQLKGFMSSATSIYRDTEAVSDILPKTVEDWDEEREKNEIVETDNVFFGDVVEYCPITCTETVLSDACFRFNTAQREIGNDAPNGDFDFTYDELLYDDFDPTDSTHRYPFLVRTYKQWLRSNEMENEELAIDNEHEIGVKRKEGYYYKPHNRIQLMKYSDKVEQGSHRTLRIRDCRPLQDDAIYIKVTTATMHGVGSNTVLYLCDGENWSEMTVSNVYDNYTFSVVPPSKDDAERNGVPYLNWVDICEGIRGGNYKLRVQNEKVPYYATRIGENLFTWREIINPSKLPENDLCRYPMSNNAFYVDSIANVYLRRQDPEGINGLYEGKYGEIDGKVMNEPNNEYKTETQIKCY